MDKYLAGHLTEDRKMESVLIHMDNIKTINGKTLDTRKCHTIKSTMYICAFSSAILSVVAVKAYYDAFAGCCGN